MLQFKRSFLLVFLLVSHVSGQQWTYYKLSDSDWCVALAIEGSTVWVGTRDNGVIKMDLNCNVLGTYTNTNGLVDNWITAIKIDKLGNKWFGTNYGISKFNGTTWVTYDTSNGLTQRNVRDIAIDRQNNMWFATSGGVSLFDGTTWRTYTTSNGLSNNIISTVAIDSRDVKWFGTGNIGGSGVSKLSGTSWTSYSSANSLADNAIFTIACDAQNNKWIGTCYGGVSRFNDTTWTTYKVATDMNNYVKSIAFDKVGNKWFGTASSGVLKFDGVSWKAYTTREGLLDDCVTSVAIDSFGNKWIGSRYGVSKLDESVVPVIQRNISKKTEISLSSLANRNSPYPILHLSLPQSMYVKIVIYNYNGKIIRLLRDGIETAGEHTVIWDGKQQNGQFAAYGHYVARLETVAKIIACNIVYTK